MKTKHLTITALFAVVLFISSFFKLPIGPVPVTTQTLFVLIIGLVLPPKLAFLASFTSLLLQCIFSNAYASPTFGFVIGFVVAATIISILTMRKKSLVISLIAVVVGTFIIYACGTIYFQMISHKPFFDVIALTMTPFLIGDTIKAILAVGLAKQLKKMI